MVRAVVFDVGHVLFDWDPRHLYRQLIDDRDRLDWFLANVVTREWHFQHDAGRPFAETSAELILRYPAERALIEAFAPRWLEQLPGAIPGSLEIVTDLDARGVPLYAITNYSHEFWTPFAAREADTFDRFSGIVVSGAEKLVKPDPAIFALAMERFGLQPGEALFVDDREDNVRAGEAAGLIGHHFRDAATLRSDLEARGVL